MVDVSQRQLSDCNLSMKVVALQAIFSWSSCKRDSLCLFIRMLQKHQLITLPDAATMAMKHQLAPLLTNMLLERKHYTASPLSFIACCRLVRSFVHSGNQM